MTHAGYILAAYLAAAVVLITMVAWVALDLWTQKRRLRELEGEGVRRRPGMPP